MLPPKCSRRLMSKPIVFTKDETDPIKSVSIRARTTFWAKLARIAKIEAVAQNTVAVTLMEWAMEVWEEQQKLKGEQGDRKPKK